MNSSSFTPQTSAYLDAARIPLRLSCVTTSGWPLAEIDPKAGQETLERLIDRYLGGRDNSLARWLLARSQEEVAIVLTPVQVFTWNYQQRMADAIPGAPDRICP